MEPEDNNPGEGTVEGDIASDDGAMDRLADILGDSDDDPNTDEDEALAGEPDDDAEDGDDPEDSDEDDQSDSDDEPENTGGKFVGDNARIKLADGTTTTVKELKDGYLRQSDYTRKRQEDAEVRKRIDAEAQRVDQTVQQLSQQHELMNSMLEQWKPQPPQDPNDYAGFIRYQQQQAAWEQWQERLQGELKQREEVTQTERTEKLKERLQSENNQLLEKIPALKDPAKRKAFSEELTRWAGEKYGFSPEEIGSLNDHRQIVVLRDLMRAERRQAQAPKVKEQIASKPKMLKGGRRGNGPAKSAQKARADRLRETGRVSDAVNVLRGLVD